MVSSDGAARGTWGHYPSLFTGTIIVPVSHIWKFDLEPREKHDFGMKWNFSKIRIGHVILNFLATTENLRNVRSEQPN